MEENSLMINTDVTTDVTVPLKIRLQRPQNQKYA